MKFRPKYYTHLAGQTMYCTRIASCADHTLIHPHPKKIISMDPNPFPFYNQRMQLT